MLWRRLPAFITSSCYHRRPILGMAQRRSLFLELLEGSAIWSAAAAHAKRSCQPGKNKSGTALPRIHTPTLAKSARVGQPQIELKYRRVKRWASPQDLSGPKAFRMTQELP